MDDLDHFFRDHTIDPKVGSARPYVPYTKDDPSPVRNAYERLNRAQRGYMTRLATQEDGIIIMRHAPRVFGPPLEPVVPELRPDRSVKTGPPVRHVHPAEASHDVPTHPSGRPLDTRHIHTAAAMSKHIDR